MPSWLKPLICLLVGLGALFILEHWGWLDVDLMILAFAHSKHLLLGMALLQILACVFMSLRYQALVRQIGVTLSPKQMTRATFVGNALGQWLPGAVTFIEVIRMAILLGDGPTKTPYVKSKLAAAALADRILGFLAMLILGGCSAFVWILTTSFSWGVFTIGVSSLALGFGLIILWVFSRIPKLRRLHHIFEALASASQRGKNLWLGVVWSLASTLCMVLSLWLGSYALFQNQGISLLVACAAFPLMSLTSIFPLGFGGIGGFQIVAGGILVLFGFSADMGASTHLLQSAINLVAISLSGSFFIPQTFNNIRIVLNSKAQNKV